MEVSLPEVVEKVHQTLVFGYWIPPMMDLIVLMTTFSPSYNLLNALNIFTQNQVTQAVDEVRRK